jgi:hypothetical protein
MLRILILAPLFIIAVSCSGGTSSTVATPVADAFCTDTTSYSGGITVTGHAQYEYRTNGNGAINGTPNPIRLAEIAVYDKTGKIIQCGTTDASGDFSVVVPNPADELVLHVNSRISNSITKAYVLNNPTDMDHYFIKSTAISGTSAVNVGNMTAPANGTLEGGAFNILDKILDANEFLTTKTTNCNADFTTCTPFTAIPLLKAFWTKGVNPGTYVNSGAVSFYIPGKSELYILGGSSGDVDNSDTDHFDNSIIVHEYGHFIEDIFSKTNSPGGSHDGDSIIDARLAWGEGWANFFQAAVLNVPVYRDTVGTPDGTTAVYFNEDLETPDNDIPTTMGEGNFREFSVTRLLWDAIDDGSLNAGSTDDDAVTSPFSELWTVFTNPTNGFKYGGNHFRNVGLFHEIQMGLSGGQDWSSLRTSEKQRIQTDYARGVASSASACAPVSIQAQNIPGGGNENGSAANSNQFASNDFYKIYHSGGTFTLGLTHSASAGAVFPYNDLDLYVYTENYKFGLTTNMAAKSITAVSSNTSSGSESISTTLASGYYMINVRVNTTDRRGSSSDYTMTLNGANLCPN